MIVHLEETGTEHIITILLQTKRFYQREFFPVYGTTTLLINRVAVCWRNLSTNGILSKDGFNSRVDSYVEALTISGAWEREYSKWNGNPVALKKDLKEEADYVKDWYSHNYDNLYNSVFKNLGTTNIVDISTNKDQTTNMNNNTLYNIMGQKVGANYRGVVINKGKKFIISK